MCREDGGPLSRGAYAPKILQIMHPKGKRALRYFPHFDPQNPAQRGDKSPVTPYRTCVRSLAGRSGGEAACEHSQELTPGLLEFKATIHVPFHHTCYKVP